MASCESLLKSALVAIVLVALVQSGSAAEKLATCCTTVSRQEVTDPILGYLIQKKSASCVQAIIFQTEKALYCSYARAPWVYRKITEFERARKNAKLLSTTSSVLPSSSASLLSIITSTSSPPSTPPSSSTSPPSFSDSTSQRPDAESSAEWDDQ
ncbi:hypothetical protein LDENG_00070310 [Lucifuga dentata]|nr:hypothetical protein LDENG_00070310 [Lucifuga dentata]